jgi:hypothetical protein
MIKPTCFEDLIDISDRKNILFNLLLEKEVVGKVFDADESLLDETAALFVYDKSCPFDLRG